MVPKYPEKKVYSGQKISQANYLISISSFWRENENKLRKCFGIF
jgi:hypothetical protein